MREVGNQGSAVMQNTKHPDGVLSEQQVLELLSEAARDGNV